MLNQKGLWPALALCFGLLVLTLLSAAPELGSFDLDQRTRAALGVARLALGAWLTLPPHSGLCLGQMWGKLGQITGLVQARDRGMESNAIYIIQPCYIMHTKHIM